MTKRASSPGHHHRRVEGELRRWNSLLGEERRRRHGFNYVPVGRGGIVPNLAYRTKKVEGNR